MEFRQDGANVTGSYVVNEISSPGLIEGRAIAEVLNFKWKSTDGNYAGDDNLILSPDGNSFHGIYRVLSSRETLTPTSWWANGAASEVNDYRNNN
jgi:hypothetical protein